MMSAPLRSRLGYAMRFCDCDEFRYNLASSKMPSREAIIFSGGNY
jgi:hypothetical protein